MNIRELAKEVGVSPAAVSIVLNGRSGVADDTRQKILEAAKKYNYILPARKTKSGKAILLLKYYNSGVFVEENQGFISSIIDSIEENLHKEHFSMTMMVSKQELAKSLQAINYESYHGMIVVGTEVTREDYTLFENIPIPFLVVDNPVPNTYCNSVHINNAENVYLALRYCKECGHDEIGYLGSKYETENFNERYRAFLLYTDELGIKFYKKNEFRVTPTMIGAHDDFSLILKNNKKLPGCFFAENDTIALGVMRALQDSKIRIPDDISIIGFDDIPYTSISSPPLTTVHVQRNIIGRQAVVQLLHLISNNDFTPVKTQLTGKLLIRKSVQIIDESIGTKN